MKIVSINSCSNLLIKKLARLQQAAFRKISGLILAEGVRTVEAMSKSMLPLKYLFFTQEHANYAPNLAQLSTQLFLISEMVLQKVSACKTPSGIVGVFEQPVYTLADMQAPGLVLADIADPGNMGTLIRSAVAFGAKSVVVVQGTDVWGYKVIQASAGTIGFIPIIACSWDELVHTAHVREINLNALVIDGPDFDCIQDKNQLLVVGNEAHGLPAQWQEQCQLRSTIAMPGGTESLNVAVAGSIALYVVLKS